MYPALAHTTSPQELADLRTFLLKAIPPKKPSLCVFIATSSHAWLTHVSTPSSRTSVFLHGGQVVMIRMSRLQWAC